MAKDAAPSAVRRGETPLEVDVPSDHSERRIGKTGHPPVGVGVLRLVTFTGSCQPQHAMNVGLKRHHRLHRCGSWCSSDIGTSAATGPGAWSRRALANPRAARAPPAIPPRYPRSRSTVTLPQQRASSTPLLASLKHTAIASSILYVAVRRTFGAALGNPVLFFHDSAGAAPRQRH